MWPPHEPRNFDARISKLFDNLASNHIVLCVCDIIFVNTNKKTQIYIKRFVKKLKIKMVKEELLTETVRKYTFSATKVGQIIKIEEKGH